MKKIFEDLNLDQHDFETSPYYLSAEQIKVACQDFTKVAEKEVRILCKQDTRESRPDVFKEKNLFLLPVKNGNYAIIRGEGYIDIPEIDTDAILFKSKLSFKPITSTIGNSEMQHVDYAFAAGLIEKFVNDNSLVLTIRGRKYTPKFKFSVDKNHLEVESVQTEVDAGYEGSNKIVLIEVKNSSTRNTIIRQLYSFSHYNKNHPKPL